MRASPEPMVCNATDNTYQRGDLNALDYRRLQRHLATHAYFADWIAFRRGAHGRLLRQWARPSETFHQFITVAGSSALAVVVNSDRSQGPVRLLFAINPTQSDVTLPVGATVAGLEPGVWELLADEERFYLSGSRHAGRSVEPQLWLPAQGCALWSDDGRGLGSVS